MKRLAGCVPAWRPPKLSRSFEDAIPNSRLVLIPAAGHVPMIERPEPFAQAVLAFLDDA